MALHPQDIKIREADFNELIKISNEIKNRVENQHLPITMVSTLFKSAGYHLSVSRKEKSNVPSYNYSLEVAPESDWRDSLYGNRYPEIGNQGSLGDNWINKDEKSRQIESKGKNSRNRVLNYRYE